MSVIPAEPGWRVLVWVRENDAEAVLQVVGWLRKDEVGNLEPLVLDYEHSGVGPFNYESGSVLFVMLMPPGLELDGGYIEQAIDVGRLAQEAEEREEQKNVGRGGGEPVVGIARPGESFRTFFPAAEQEMRRREEAAAIVREQFEEAGGEELYVMQGLPMTEPMASDAELDARCALGRRLIRCGYAVIADVGARPVWTQESANELVGKPFQYLRWPNLGEIVAAEPWDDGQSVRVEVWAQP